MNTQLATVRQVDFSQAMQMGDVFYKSGFFKDLQSAAQCVTKIMAGAEYGMGPFSSLQNIHLIQGKPTLAANAMAAAVKANPKYDYKVTRLDDEVCEITFFQNGDPIGVSQFTIEDAKKAGTQNLQKFARNMMFARAMSNGVKWYCPDVFATAVYVPEEMGATVDGEGHIVSVHSTQDAEDFVVQKMREDYAALLEEGAALGISRKELPPNAHEDVIQKYIIGLKKAIDRKQGASEASPAPTTLSEAVAAKREAASVSSDPAGEAVFDAEIEEEPAAVQTPAPGESEGDAPKESKALKAFFAAANEKVLSDDRDKRIDAVNQWLLDSRKDAVESITDVPDVLLVAMRADIKTGKLTW